MTAYEDLPTPTAKQQLDELEDDLLALTATASRLQITLDRLLKQRHFLQHRNDLLEQQLYGEQQRNKALLDQIYKETEPKYQIHKETEPK